MTPDAENSASRRSRTGDDSVAYELIPLVYAQLRALAAKYIYREAGLPKVPTVGSSQAIWRFLCVSTRSLHHSLSEPYEADPRVTTSADPRAAEPPAYAAHLIRYEYGPRPNAILDRVHWPDAIYPEIPKGT